jgi:hypothetical protein
MIVPLEGQMTRSEDFITVLVLLYFAAIFTIAEVAVLLKTAQITRKT